MGNRLSVMSSLIDDSRERPTSKPDIGDLATRKSFELPELLRAIFFFLRPEWTNLSICDQQRKRRLRALARSARVSRLFKEIVHEILWGEQYGLDVFVALFDGLVSRTASLIFRC